MGQFHDMLGHRHCQWEDGDLFCCHRSHHRKGHLCHRHPLWGVRRALFEQLGSATTWGQIKTGLGWAVPWMTHPKPDHERREWCRQSNELMGGWTMNKQRKACGLDGKLNSKRVVMKEPTEITQSSPSSNITKMTWVGKDEWSCVGQASHG